MTLDQILAPVSVKTFFDEYAGERVLRVEGEAGRFHSLVTWNQLNDALSSMRVDNERVMLVRQAQAPLRSSYILTFPDGKSQYLIGPALMRHIAEGATLVVKQVDEIFPAVRRMSELCEREFGIYCSANLYAGWRRENGFDIHWDRHDTLILQVRGRKQWKVWYPTREHPLEGDAVPPPSKDLFWEGMLNDGDILYMPRGWWHVAFPADEPSLHLTIGLHHATGMDFLAWISEQMRDSVHARCDVPHWKDVEAQQEWIGHLRDRWNTLLSTDPVGRFTRGRAERAHTRPFVRLPETSIAAVPKVDPSTPLRLTSGRQLHFEQQNGKGALTFKALGTNWSCDESLRPALALLSHNEPSTIDEMARNINERGRALLRPFILSLLMAEVIWAEPSGSVEARAGGSNS